MDITELLAFSAQQGASDLYPSASLPPMIRVKVAQMYSDIQAGQAIGMQTVDQCLQGLVEKRIITVDAAREKAREPYSIAL